MIYTIIATGKTTNSFDTAAVLAKRANSAVACNGTDSYTIDAALFGYQEQGTAPSGSEANDAIHAARTATPADVRCLYRSSIRWNGNGYTWFWVLKA